MAARLTATVVVFFGVCVAIVAGANETTTVAGTTESYTYPPYETSTGPSNATMNSTMPSDVTTTQSSQGYTTDSHGQNYTTEAMPSNNVTSTQYTQGYNNDTQGYTTEAWSQNNGTSTQYTQGYNNDTQGYTTEAWSQNNGTSTQYAQGYNNDTQGYTTEAWPQNDGSSTQYTQGYNNDTQGYTTEAWPQNDVTSTQYTQGYNNDTQGYTTEAWPQNDVTSTQYSQGYTTDTQGYTTEPMPQNDITTTQGSQDYTTEGIPQNDASTQQGGYTTENSQQGDVTTAQQSGQQNDVTTESSGQAGNPTTQSSNVQGSQVETTQSQGSSVNNPDETTQAQGSNDGQWTVESAGGSVNENVSDVSSDVNATTTAPTTTLAAPTTSTERVIVEWGNWTTCTLECGGGRRVRRRKCREFDFSCAKTGVEVDEQDCNVDDCPRLPRHEAKMSIELKLNTALKPEQWLSSVERKVLPKIVKRLNDGCQSKYFATCCGLTAVADRTYARKTPNDYLSVVALDDVFSRHPQRKEGAFSVLIGAKANVESPLCEDFKVVGARRRRRAAVSFNSSTDVTLESVLKALFEAAKQIDEGGAPTPGLLTDLIDSIKAVTNESNIVVMSVRTSEEAYAEDERREEERSRLRDEIAAKNKLERTMQIVAIGAGVGGGLLILVLLIVFCCMYRNAKKAARIRAENDRKYKLREPEKRPEEQQADWNM